MTYTIEIGETMNKILIESAKQRNVSLEEFFKKAFISYVVLCKEVSLGNSLVVFKGEKPLKELVLD